MKIRLPFGWTLISRRELDGLDRMRRAWDAVLKIGKMKCPFQFEPDSVEARLHDAIQTARHVRNT